jgi:hypothetical protein
VHVEQNSSTPDAEPAPKGDERMKEGRASAHRY